LASGKVLLDRCRRVVIVPVVAVLVSAAVGRVVVLVQDVVGDESSHLVVVVVVVVVQACVGSGRCRSIITVSRTVPLHNIRPCADRMDSKANVRMMLIPMLPPHRGI
jgi:type III secretory pathway component EscS